MTGQIGNWFTVYTRPRCEKKIAKRLCDKNIETFCPLKRTLRQWSDRKKIVTEPLFASYVFVRITYKEWNLVLSEPCVINFVHWLGKPAVVKDHEINAIKMLIGECADPVIEKISYSPGDEIRIVSGPLKDSIGIVINVKKQKVVLRLTNLSCQISAEIPKRSLVLN